MKRIKVLILGLLVICLLSVDVFGYDFPINNKSHNINEQITVLELSNVKSLGVEPLMVRAVVVKKKANQTLIRIVSETYRNRLFLIDGNIDAKKGDYIEGFLGKNKFAPINNRRLR
ncbi:hypothetical protein [Hippea jasoniae]|uniref:hypothetical protein n=1 Tax=Hippea jasoniae TaxID=944479 RepID=UPI0005522176|nr:hypothetical protein [Hippea jasoniae]